MDSFLHDMSWVVPLRSPELTRIFSAITLLGYFEFFLVMLPLGYWLWDKALFTRLAILVGIVGLSNSFLKDLFQDPRPPIGLALDGRVGDSFGLPSGHAQVATAMWVWLAYEIKRPWAWIVAILTAAGVCASRLYLAVHDIEDILGGILLGLGSIAVFAVLISDDLKAWHNLNPAIQLAAIAALAPLMWLIWPRHPLPPSIYALVAFIFFWWLGRAIEQRAIHYKRHKNWIFAGFATVAGIAVLFGFMWISAKPLEALPKDAALAIQFAVISLYVTALAPAAFRAIGLADRSVT
jgi:membrane-associated phospholipid phosphatase